MNHYEQVVLGGSLSRDGAFSLLEQFFQRELTEIQLAAIFAVLSSRGVNSHELSGFRDCVWSHAKSFPMPSSLPSTVDLCGTGGDGKNTFNISTASAFVVAGSGIPVVKHGNSASTSHTGSSDVVKELGLPLLENPDDHRAMVLNHHFTYLHGPFFHPVMKEVAPVRKALGIRTVFNLLGPLLNPVSPTFQIIGVASKRDIEVVSEATKLLNKNILVLHCSSGYDEVSLTGKVFLRGLSLNEELSPEDFGLASVTPEGITGGETSGENASILREVLSSDRESERVRVVLANAGLAIAGNDLASGKSDKLNLKSGVERARESLYSGGALKILTGVSETNV